MDAPEGTARVKTNRMVRERTKTMMTDIGHQYEIMKQRWELQNKRKCNLETIDYWDCFSCQMRWECKQSKASTWSVWFWRIVFSLIVIAVGAIAIIFK